MREVTDRTERMVQLEIMFWKLWKKDDYCDRVGQMLEIPKMPQKAATAYVDGRGIK